MIVLWLGFETLTTDSYYLNTWALAGGVFRNVVKPLGGRSFQEEVSNRRGGGVNF